MVWTIFCTKTYEDILNRTVLYTTSLFWFSTTQTAVGEGVLSALYKRSNQWKGGCGKGPPLHVSFDHSSVSNDTVHVALIYGNNRPRYLYFLSNRDVHDFTTDYNPGKKLMDKRQNLREGSIS